ncbi:P-type conjugative transfer protein TrbL [Enterobacter kobei]|uniref:P-type conjugative transfer protein TrbL n=1 Tax=Enterobacter kobei TaxID=208224 RepID=UPI003CF1FC64
MFRVPRFNYLLFPLLLFPGISFAASSPDSGSVDEIIKVFQDTTQKWEPVILHYTLGLFWGLVTISFTWSSIKIALKDGGLVDVMADLVTRVMTVGISVFLLKHAADLARSLISSFQMIGTNLSGGSVKFSPGNVIELGMNIVGTAWQKISLTSPVASILFCFSALIILICFALMAADITILIVSAFVTVSGGIAMMGFLGSEWTRDHALNYFTAVLGIAVRMFIMQLIFSLGYTFINDFAAGIDGNSSDIQYLFLLAISIVFYGLMKEIPQMASSLASGRFTHDGGGLSEAITAAASIAAGAALAASGVGGAAMDAYKDAMGGGSNDQSAADDDVMKRAMDTGPANPGTASATSGAEAGSGGGGENSAASPPGRMAAVGAGLKAAAGAMKDVSKSSVKGATLSMANRTMLGRAMAQAGVRDGEEPTQEQKARMHQFLMQSMSRPSPAAADTARDDGNDPDNYRDNLDEEKHHHDE